MAGTGGAIVVLLQVILPLFGVELSENEISAFVEAVVTLVGTVMFVVGQVRRPDLIGGIVRR